MNVKIIDTKRQHMEEIIQLLQNISPQYPKKELYEDIWTSFIEQPNVYSCVAINKSIVVGYGALVIEAKIRGGKLGHIEDIASHNSFKKRGIGTAIVKYLFEIAKTKGCYKTVLQCKENQVGFYKKCFFKTGGLAMQKFNF